MLPGICLVVQWIKLASIGSPAEEPVILVNDRKISILSSYSRMGIHNIKLFPCETLAKY